MQSSNENDKKDKAAKANSELSATWQALLGQQANTAADVQQVQHPQHLTSNPVIAAGNVQQVQHPQHPTSDPWSHLLNVQGMQAVDLQKVRLHEALADDQDIEHALDIMREVSNEQPAPDAKSKDTK